MSRLSVVVLYFFVSLVIYYSEAREYVLYQEKIKPFWFEGEMDRAITLRTMFQLANKEYQLIELEGSELLKKQQESLFGMLPILEIIEDEESKFSIDYYKTAERVVAADLNFLPKRYQEKVEELTEIIDTVWERFLFGDGLADGHQRLIFLSNFEREWCSPAFRQLNKLSDDDSKFLTSDKVTIADIKLAMFMNYVPANTVTKVVKLAQIRDSINEMISASSN